MGTRLRRLHLREWLVAVQVAACAVLLVGAGVLVQSMRHFANAETGLSTDHVMVAQFGDGLTAARGGGRARFADRAARLPGVRAVARVGHVPFSGPSDDAAVEVDGQRRFVRSNIVSPAYFDIVGQRLLGGRVPSASENASGAPLAVVTETAARRLWPGRSAVGQSIRLAAAEGPGKTFEIIGIVADARSGVLWDHDAAYVYFPAPPSADLPLLVRFDGVDGELERALRALAHDLDSEVPLVTRALPAVLNDQVAPFGYSGLAALVIGALGLVLAAVGLYGVVAFTVRQRTREIAIRVALGAVGRDVLGTVLRREMTLVAAGLGAGLLLATGEQRLLAHSVVPFQALDPIGWGAIAVGLIGVAAVATLVPAREALRVDPMTALRQD